MLSLAASELLPRPPLASTPLISVCLLTYNHEQYITDSLLSILTTGYPNLEIIAYDNGSADKTFEKIKAFQSDFAPKMSAQVKLIPVRQEIGLPVTQALNDMASRASGEYYLFMSGDDLCTSAHFYSHIDRFLSEPQLKVVYAQGFYFSEENGINYNQTLHPSEYVQALIDCSPEAVLDQFYAWRLAGFSIPTALIKRDFFHAIGGYDADILADDLALNLRLFQGMTERSEFSFVSVPVMLYRQHATNSYKDFARQSQLCLEWIPKYVPKGKRRKSLARLYFECAKAAFSPIYGSEHAQRGAYYMMMSLVLSMRWSRLKEWLGIFEIRKDCRQQAHAYFIKYLLQFLVLRQKAVRQLKQLEPVGYR